MADEEQTRLLELQMEELRASYGIKIDKTAPKNPKSDNSRSANSEKIAKLYEDAAEYEEELKCFEDELVVINANELKDIPSALTKAFPDYDGNYSNELKVVLEAGWTYLVEVEKTHPQEALEIIKETEFTDALEKLNTRFSDPTNDFETDIRNILVKRWEMLVSIKKEHVKEELAEMKLRGMKPDHIRKVYRKFHGLD